ncbi:MAG: RNA polymerase-binding protein RbpA [Actinobacteria bacterium]|nr:RNA polymerase-binding protein RbpA [Actinomycetota bacterium]
MADGALRGTRLGTLSYETDENVRLADRQAVYYDCSCGTTIELPFSLEAEIPSVWECRCGAEALLRGGQWPEKKPEKPVRTHWDMLLERRSVAELEELLTESLDILRSGVDDFYESGNKGKKK